MQFGLIEMWQAMVQSLERFPSCSSRSPSSRSICLSNGSSFSVGPFQVQTGRPEAGGLVEEGADQGSLALSTKKENKGSHLARVTAAGIQNPGRERSQSVHRRAG